MKVFTEDELRWSSYPLGNIEDIPFDIHVDGDIEIEVETGDRYYKYLFIPIDRLKEIVETAESWLKAKREYEKQHPLSASAGPAA